MVLKDVLSKIYKSCKSDKDRLGILESSRITFCLITPDICDLNLGGQLQCTYGLNLGDNLVGVSTLVMNEYSWHLIHNSTAASQFHCTLAKRYAPDLTYTPLKRKGKYQENSDFGVQQLIFYEWREY